MDAEAVEYRKRVFCADLALGDRVDDVFCVTRVERRLGRNGTPFLRLSVSDRTGTLAAVAWDGVEDLLEVLTEGGYARVRAEVGDYRDELQLRVVGAEAVTARLDPVDFLPRGPMSGEESVAAIREFVLSFADPDLRGLVLDFLDDARFSRAFTAAPAAKVNHHAYVGGLAEHTLSVMRLCAMAAEHYGDLDRDLLLAGAFCHDIGKIAELAVEPGFPYTEEGGLLGHIPIGFVMVREQIARRPDFPAERATDLGHLVLSHQGELEWGSPVEPQTLEALVLHFLDNLDSKVGSARPHLAGVGQGEGGRTGYVRSLRRSLFRRGSPVPPTGLLESGEPALFDGLDRPPD